MHALRTLSAHNCTTKQQRTLAHSNTLIKHSNTLYRTRKHAMNTRTHSSFREHSTALESAHARTQYNNFAHECTPPCVTQTLANKGLRKPFDRKGLLTESRKPLQIKGSRTVGNKGFHGNNSQNAASNQPPSCGSKPLVIMYYSPDSVRDTRSSKP